jgi:tRNA nucleotidyltransferase (CCA-adding enzyme)
MNPKVIQICKLFDGFGGTVYLTGGAVRDLHLGLDVKDFDLECYNLYLEKVLEICNLLGKTDLVGQSFGIIKLTIDNETFDISIPRTERKVGITHKDFAVSLNPFLDKKEACRRRDYTLSALMLNPLNNELLDFFGGLDDIRNKIIRHIDDKTFVDDSLRVLRAAQFAARFNFAIAEETIELCKSIDLSDLPVERIKEELFKLLLKSEKPSVGMKALMDTLAMLKLFPELYIADLDVLDEAAKINILKTEPERLALMLAALLYNNPQPEKFLDKMQIFTLCGFDVRKQALLTIEHRDKPRFMERSRANYLRLANTGVNFSILNVLALALEHVYNPSISDVVTFTLDFNFYDIPMENGRVKPILTGKHLLELGMEAGIEMGKVLKEVFEKQLDDEIDCLEEACNYVGRNYQHLCGI